MQSGGSHFCNWVAPLSCNFPVHPATNGKVHKSIVVVTGYLDEEVSNEIEIFNKGQLDSGYPDRTIEVWAMGDLVTLFSKHLSSFGPEEPEYVRRWLELFLNGGKGFPDRESLAALIDFAVETAELKNAENAKHLISYLMLLVGSIANQYVEEKNFGSEVELWFAVLPTVLFLQEKYSIKQKDAELDRAILFEIIRDLLKKISAEVKTKKRFTDFEETFEPFEQQFAARTAGLLALHVVLERELGKISDVALNEKLDQLEAVLRVAKFTGESSIVYTLLVDLVLLKFGRQSFALAHINSSLRTLLHSHSGTGTGLPAPYYDLETIALNFIGEEVESNLPDDNFKNSSFTLRALIFLFVCMNLRKMVEDVWPEITHFKCSEFEPDSDIDLLSWRSKNGINWTRMFETPQSWAKLVAEAQSLRQGANIPKPVKDEYIELLCLLYAQPFRLTSRVACRLFEIMKLPASSTKTPATPHVP